MRLDTGEGAASDRSAREREKGSGGVSSEVAAPSEPVPRLNLPNILSALRLASTPVFVALFVAGAEKAAVLVFGIAALTDFFDGYIARRTGAITELGKLLDPLSDRVLITALAVALVARSALPWWLAAAVIGRDVLVLSLFPYFDRLGVARLPVNFTGKLATACLLFGLPCLAWGETSFPLQGAAAGVGITFTIAGAVLYWGAGMLYARDIRGRLRTRTTRTPPG